MADYQSNGLFDDNYKIILVRSTWKRVVGVNENSPSKGISNKDPGHGFHEVLSIIVPSDYQLSSNSHFIWCFAQLLE